MRLALAIASLVVFAVHGWVFYDQFFHKWERYQTAYFDQARTQARNEAERAELSTRSPRIEQTIVTQFGGSHVDRCTTCHIGSDDPRFAGLGHPLKAHPYTAALGDVQRGGRWERRHKFNDFGCTVCHDGQGRGLTDHYAHGEDHYWPDPLIGYVAQETWKKEYVPLLRGKEYMEAKCAQCHTEENFAGTPHVSRGRQLFFEKNCYGCHRIEGLSDGTLGPELTEVGAKFKVDYLWESIVDPRAGMATSFMPKFKLTNEEVRDLVIFLKSRRGVNLTETSLSRYRTRIAGAPEVKPAAVTAVDTIARGRELVKERACAACHKVGEVDGGIAPDLSFEGLIKESEWLMDHFRNPRHVIPDSIMPAFRFAGADFEAMTAYLVSLRTTPATAVAADNFKNLCARCHGDKGDGLGMSATYIDPAPRDLTKVAFMNSKPRERFVESVRNGVHGTSMAAWGKALTEPQIEALVDHIYSTFVKQQRQAVKARNLPEQNPVATSKESIARGEATYNLRCTGCHGKKADGKGPNSLDIIPRPRNLRNSPFVSGLGDRRLLDSILYGVQGTAMPPWIDYGLSVKDAGDLVNYIRSLTQASSRPQMRAGIETRTEIPSRHTEK
ncbi:MAG: c-type cytochrome [Bryobacteraceae bacterium]|nr:c-type cytochrome [Bryobacteraceae bacterium]